MTRLEAAKENFRRLRENELIFNSRITYIFAAIILVRGQGWGVIADLWVAFLALSVLGITILEWIHKRTLDKREKEIGDD